FLGLYFGLGGFQPAAPQATETTPVPLGTATAEAVLPPTATAPAAPTEGSQPTAEQPGGGAAACNFKPEPASGFGYGIQSHVFGGGDPAYWLTLVADQLGFNWVKIQVRWLDLQPSQEGIF